MVARKLGIARDEARIRRAVEFSSFKALQAQEAQSGFIEKSLHSRRFFRAGRAGGWREVLAPAQAAMMERNHTEQMRRFGYLPPLESEQKASCPCPAFSGSRTTRSPATPVCTPSWRTSYYTIPRPSR